MTSRLNLVVIRTHDRERSVQFYSTLGLTFVREQHGSGLEHWAASAGTTTFEIYPATQEYDASGIRIGFEVTSVASILDQLAAMGATIHRPLRESPWGRQAVVRDFDGHTVELSQPH